MNDIIKQIYKKIKFLLKIFLSFLNNTDVFCFLLLILLSSISFFLGVNYQKDKIKKNNFSEIKLINKKEKIYFLASKKGKYYYLP